MNVAFRQDVISAREYAATSLNPAIDTARVEIFDNLQAAEPAWRQLEALGALTTPYQRFEWILLWQRHVGQSEGITPLIIVATDAFGTPLFVLPLALRRTGSLVIAGFFGGRHTNLNAGLWRRDLAAAVSAETLRAILTRAALACGVDVIKLVSQPSFFEGAGNPLALLPHQPAPDDVYSTKLIGRTGDEVLRSVLKSGMRSRLRTKERKLQELRGYRYAVAATPADVDRYLDAFFKQKAAHLAAQGLPNIFDDRKIVAFLRAASHHGLSDRRPVIELHALECDAEVIAIFGGVNNGRRLSCMINSYTAGEAGRWSPGLVLMTHLITRCGETGIASLDLGAGHAPYKTFFCKDNESTFDTIIGFTPKGRMAASLLAPARRMKRWVKSTPLLFEASKLLRRIFA